MKNNKPIHLLLQAMIIIALPSLSFADITLLTDSPDSCDKFNQFNSVIIVHDKNCLPIRLSHILDSLPFETAQKTRLLRANGLNNV